VTSELPKWPMTKPERKKFEQGACFICGYNGEKYFQPSTHKCAERYHANSKRAFYESRLRLAVGGLRSARKACNANNYEGCMDIIDEVLAAIGPLPKKGK
jgi:hypothetical protein